MSESRRRCEHPRCVFIVDTRTRSVMVRTDRDDAVERRVEDAFLGISAYCPDCGYQNNVGPMASKWPQWIQRILGRFREWPKPTWYNTEELKALAEELEASSE